LGLGYLVRVDVRDSGGFQILSNGFFDEFGYIAVLPFGEIAKLLLDNAGKVNSHKGILKCHQPGFNLDLPGHPPVPGVCDGLKSLLSLFVCKSNSD
jgi:hypothetical protein